MMAFSGTPNDIQMEFRETVRAQANSRGREVPAAHVARPEVDPPRRVAQPEVVASSSISIPNRIRIDSEDEAKSQQTFPSPIQGVGSLLGFSDESVEAAEEETAVDVDEIFLRAIDIRL